MMKEKKQKSHLLFLMNAGRSLFVLTLGFAGMTNLYAAGSTELKTEPTPYLADDELPARTAPIVEVGEKFLSTGNINKGFTLPTGAVWTPSLWVYGNLRTAYQTYSTNDTDDKTVREWANNLDLFANVQLSGTERVLIGFTPLQDRKTGSFSGKIFSPDDQERSVNELNLEIDTFFFEGDFAELFPNLDREDSTRNDIGFTVGRQRILFMDGFLINDSMDGFGLSKNNVRFSNMPNLVNFRSSFFYAWEGINRNDNQEDKSADLFAVFNQFDTVDSTYNLDFAYVNSDDQGDLLNVGIDSIRRFGKLNTTFRAAFSQATDGVTENANNGTLLFTELSFVPARTEDNVYLNGFWGIDQFTSAARGPTRGGPLGRTGLLFAAQGLGTFPSALSNRAEEVAGMALGYQKIFNQGRQQLTFEIGTRQSQQDSVDPDESGIYARYQHALGRRTLIQFDTFATDIDGGDTEHGARVELQFKL